MTLHQYCATLKTRGRILFHFHRRINVISTLIHNVETTFIRRQIVGWEGWPTKWDIINKYQRYYIGLYLIFYNTCGKSL